MGILHKVKSLLVDIQELIPGPNRMKQIGSLMTGIDHNYDDVQKRIVYHREQRYHMHRVNFV